jgi:uncharacterized protein YggE
MKKNILLFVLNFGLIMGAFAQASGNEVRANYTYGNNNNSQPSKANPISRAELSNDSTMIIETNVLMNVLANSYTAILSLTQTGEKLAEVNQTLESRIQSFSQELQKNGIEKQYIFLDFVSQVPTYEYEVEKKIFSRTSNEVPTGFELKKNLHITYFEPEQLDKIMLIAANFEIYDLVKVDYHVKNMEVIYDTLRTQAIGLIQKKTRQLAALGINFKPENHKYQTLAEDITSSYPDERYASYTAFSSSNPKKNIKTQNEYKKNITYYYSKVGYNNYELVINPIVQEPAIQFSYSLKVRYSLKKH